MLLWRGEAVPASLPLESAVTIRPDHVPSYNNLAKAYFLAGLPELAVASYEEVLRRTRRIPSRSITSCSWPWPRQPRRCRHLPAGVSRHPGRAVPQASHRRGRAEHAITHLAANTAAAGAPPPTPLPVVPVPKPQPPRTGRLTPSASSSATCPRDSRAARRPAHLTGYTRGQKERAMLDRVLGKPVEVLDLTSDDSGDPHRMIEIDAVLFNLTGLNRSPWGSISSS